MTTLLLQKIDRIVKRFLTALAECAKGASYALNH